MVKNEEISEKERKMLRELESERFLRMLEFQNQVKVRENCQENQFF